MNKRIIFASSATLLTLFATNPVSASENTTETPVVSTEETTILSTTKTPTTVGATTEETTTMTPTTETPTTEAVIEKPTEPTNVIKEGKTITIQNPSVSVAFPNGKSKYASFTVAYQDISIPDSVTIHAGDTLTIQMPKETTFPTNFTFDVRDASGEIVGQASTDIASGVVNITFNNVFESKPLNKHISMTFDAKWNDTVKPEETVPLNFSGTIENVTLAKEEGPTPGELLAKWGSQDKDDAQVINWTIRVNSDSNTIANATLRDRWGANQEYVADSFKIYFVKDIINWTGLEDAKSYLNKFNVLSDGFDVKLKTFNKILYMDYKTRLKTPVKDATNPTNHVNYKADNNVDVNNYKAVVSLVGGRGFATGENIVVPPADEETTTLINATPDTTTTTTTETTTTEEAKSTTQETLSTTVESTTENQTTVADTPVETTEAIKQPELPNTGVESIAQYVVSGLAVLGSAVGLLRKKGE